MQIPSTKILDQIRQKYDLGLILLHGSQVSGDTHAKSDVDIAVLSKDRSKNLDSYVLTSDLNEVFGVDSVDVTVLNHANPLLLKTVTDNAKLLSGTTTELFKLKLKAFHAYNDYLPYLKMESDFVRSQL
ncbi:nucleotidyltransferase domain-containing protein [Candidatus Woesebacteria bacterium]|nr:nucleotidyltransferase domain-containing protein [Candidatus Woesebacteria bacterium]